MERYVAQYQSKINQLLAKFLEPEYQIKNDVYLNRLLTHISGKDKAEIESAVISMPIFTAWLLQAVKIWEKQGPSPNIASFSLNVAALLSKDEERFVDLARQNLYVDLLRVLKVKDEDTPATVKLGYIKLLTAFLEHKAGIECLMTSNLWQDILNLSLMNQTIYITREGQKFMCKILKESFKLNEEFTKNLVKTIIAPLGGENLAIKSNCEIEEDVFYQTLSPTLLLLGSILEHFLESSGFAEKDYQIVQIFLKDFHLEQRVCNYMMIVQNRHLVFELGKIMFIITFLELYINVVTLDFKAGDCQVAERKIMSIFNTNICKGNYDHVMKFCYFGHYYWNTMGYKIPCVKLNRHKENLTFSDQMVVLQMLPLFCLMGKQCYNEKFGHFEKNLDEFRDRYIEKLFKIMCESTVRLAYTWRNYLMSQHYLFGIATQAITYIMKSRKYYPRQRAATVFQCFIYCFKDLILAIKEQPEKLSIFGKEVQCIGLLLDALAVFIEEFNITWRDSVETICVMSTAFDFLSIPTWDSQLVVKALKLVEISISKYMSPNMALLIDKVNGSTMALVGPLLFAKAHDGAWEVRDSALEVVHTISHFSSVKFPSLQKVLVDSDLPGLMLKMSAGDGEYFVRATALKCLQEMVKVEEIWNNCLTNERLPEKMTQLLLDETEGVVRVEAASLMCVIYEQQKFPADVLDKIYEIMIHASTTDLHWEVKVRALGFWEHVIRDHLHNQGMIDGSFPSVTFSKENRKIVTLTDIEIRKRLNKVLVQLSSIGCLGVLISAINDDCDVEVSKTAVKVTQDLVRLLRAYKVQDDGPSSDSSSNPTSPIDSRTSISFSSGVSTISTAADDTQDTTMSLDQFNDDIIDQIVNARDICLLKDVYSPSDYGSVSNYEVQVKKIVKPGDFLHFIKRDLDGIVTEKKNWLDGMEDFGSLLDDMLKTYDDTDDNDVNNMDCY